MRKILSSAILGSALLFIPVGGGIASAAEAPAPQVAVNTDLRPVEDTDDREARQDYRRGFRTGFSDGYSDAKDDCFLSRSSTRSLKFGAWAQGYEDGYTKGYERAYDRFCG